MAKKSPSSIRPQAGKISSINRNNLKGIENDASSFKDILNSIPAMVAVYNINTGKYLYVNKSIKNLLGFSANDFIQKGLEFASSLVHPEDIGRITKENMAALESANKNKNSDIDTIVNFEYRLKHKDGKYRWLHTDGSVFSRDKKGNVECVLNISIDITKRKEDEENIQDLTENLESKVNDRTNKLIISEERYKNIFNLAPVSIWEQDFSIIKKKIDQLKKRGVKNFEEYFLNHPDFIEWAIDSVKIVDVNDATVKLYGAKNKTQLMDSLDKVFVPETRKVFIGQLLTIAKNQKVYSSETVSRKLSGEEFNLLFTIVFPDQKSEFKNVLISIIDITERKRIERELLNSEERLRLATSAGRIGIWDWDIEKNIITWSDSVYEMHGTTKRKFKGSFEEYQKFIFPEDKEKVIKAIDKAVGNKEPYQIEFRSYGPNNSIIWIFTSARVLFNEKKEAIRMIGASIDITERKKLEQRKDDFIALASHELKTPITSLKIYTQVLSKHFKKNNDKLSAKYLDTMDEQIEKLNELVTGLLDVSMVQKGKIPYKKEVFDLSELIRETSKNITAVLFYNFFGNIKT